LSSILVSLNICSSQLQEVSGRWRLLRKAHIGLHRRLRVDTASAMKAEPMA